MQVYFSNRVETLYKQLKNELFGQKENPFARRWVVVYGPAMKSWLTWQMANDPDLEIATGVEIILLNQVFSKLLEQLGGSSFHIPNIIEIAFAIEFEIKSIICSCDSLSCEEKALWQPLFGYLGLDEVSSHLKLSRKNERRLVSLSQQVASLFSDYGRYGGELVAEWKDSEPKHWQHELWVRLFCRERKWSYLSRELANLPIPSMKDITLWQLHFFSISFVSANEFTFLQRLSKKMSVGYYLLSPCAAFWADIFSDRESNVLKKYWKGKGIAEGQLIALDEFLRDRNPLLANFGRLGREMVEQIDRHVAQIHRHYHLPSVFYQSDLYQKLIQDDIEEEMFEKKISLLGHLQADLLLMRNPMEDVPVSISHEDKSIQVHIAGSLKREVEVLYTVLMNLIDRHAEDVNPLAPSDIIVIAPDISEYEMWIKNTFEGHESQLTCQIIDLNMQTESLIVLAFWRLIELGKGRWDAASLLALFEDRAFQRCHGLKQEDVFQIKRWIEATGIRWGVDSSHRNELLRQQHCLRGMIDDTAIGTWEHGLTRLTLGLAMIQDEEQESALNHLPQEEGDFSHGDLLSRCIKMVSALRDDLTPLYDGTELSLADWAAYLSCLLRTYFTPDDLDKTSTLEFHDLLSQIDLLRKTSEQLNGALYAFYSVKKHLEKILSQKRLGYKENQSQAVRFCSMLPLRAVPARVIVLIGMQDGKFPRCCHHSSLDLLSNHSDRIYRPSQVDYDRYLFLEALLSARDYLIITYQEGELDGGKSSLPSLLVTELLGYLDQNYQIQGKSCSAHCSHRHPFDAFDKEYFNENSPYPSYSISAFRAALAYYHPQRKDPHSFFSRFTFQELPVKLDGSKEIVIDIKQLNAVAKHPLKVYLNKTLGIYLDRKEERIVKIDEELQVSKITRHMLLQKMLTKSSFHAIQRAEQQGRLPFGAFKTVSYQKLTEEAFDLQRQVADLGITPEEIFQIDLHLGCHEPVQKTPSRWQFPAIVLPYSDEMTVKIVGTLANATPQGLVILGKGSFGSVWKAWPQFLLFTALCSISCFPWKRTLSFVHPSHQAQSFAPFFDDPLPLLTRFMRYYFVSLQSPSPLLPEWILSFLTGDAEELGTKIEKSLNDPFSPIDDEYVKWVFNSSHPPDTVEMMKTWKAEAESLAGEIIEHWFTASKKTKMRIS